MLKLSFVLFFLFLVNGYACARTAWWWGAVRRQLYLPGFFFLFFLIQSFAPIFTWTWAKHIEEALFCIPEIIVQISFFSLGVMACYVIYLLLSDALLLFTTGIFRFAVSRCLKDIITHKYKNTFYLNKIRHFVLFLLLFSTILSLVLGSHNIRRYDITEVDLFFTQLPPAFDKTKIALITDLHVGPFIKGDYVEHVVKSINKLEPDFIVLGGDFVDGTVQALERDVEPLSKLKSKHGTFFVTGNHEFYWNEGAWREHFTKLNINVLQNSHFVFRKNDQTLAFIGLPDRSSLRFPHAEKLDLTKALQPIDPSVFKILIAHQPIIFKEAQEKGIELQLSGHTHAGQFFPFSFFVRLAQPLFSGHYQKASSQLYVSRGIGFWGVPLRSPLGGEIVILTLHRKTI